MKRGIQPGEQLSTRFRKRRDVRLRRVIGDIAQRKGSVSILDMGGTSRYWDRVGLDFLRKNHATVTIVNLHGSEISPIPEATDILRLEVGDACRLPQYGDGVFDLAHSNSVIEHVVTWDNMKAFAAETRRIGQSYYVQSPYFWFPIDPHFYKFPLFHWLPRPLRARLVNQFPIAHAGTVKGVDMAMSVVDDARLLDARQFQFLFSDGVVFFERFCGLAKSMIAVRH